MMPLSVIDDMLNRLSGRRTMTVEEALRQLVSETERAAKMLDVYPDDLGVAINDARAALGAAEKDESELVAALRMAVQVAGEARLVWDAAPAGMRAGKILIALSGECPGYRADTDEIHRILAKHAKE